MYKTALFHWIESEEDVLLTNDMGYYAFISPDSFKQLTVGELPSDSPLYEELKEKGFLYEDEERFISDHLEEMTCMKQCLMVGTQLLILVLTNACNQRCVYCQAGEVHAAKTSIDTCKKAVDMAVQSPVAQMTIEFQGGEPTLNPEALRFTIPYAKRVFAEHGKKVDFAIVTNLTDCDAELIRWLVEEDVHISTSLDGHKPLHDANRPLASHKSSYDAWRSGARIYQECCVSNGKPQRISAIQTTTRESLLYPHEIVDEYLANGINRLYIRPLTPLGCAKERWENIGYTPEEYLHFYSEIVDDMIERCKHGEDVVECTASLYLVKILKGQSVGHTEYRSPCGAGIGQMAVNFDGNVFTCDEGRMIANMGDPIFRMGTVDNSYRELMRSPVVHAVCTASCVESLPFCHDCVYAPYCSVCPVVNYGLEGDLVSHEERSYRCEISKGILRFLFAKIRRSDPEEMAVLRCWAED